MFIRLATGLFFDASDRYLSWHLLLFLNLCFIFERILTAQRASHAQEQDTIIDIYIQIDCRLAIVVLECCLS